MTDEAAGIKGMIERIKKLDKDGNLIIMHDGDDVYVAELKPDETGFDDETTSG